MIALSETRYVVDASVVIAHLISEKYTSHADALFEFSETTLALYIPEFCYLECTNVLWKQVRFEGMSIQTAKMLITDLRDLPLNIAMMSDLLERSLDIGLAHSLAIYDSFYIALAQNLDIPLITADTKQANTAQAVGAKVKPLTDFSSQQP